MKDEDKPKTQLVEELEALRKQLSKFEKADISQRKRAEEEQIRLQNELFEKTIESLPHPFYVIDANDYTIKMANSATTVFGSISEKTTCYALTHKVSQPCRGAKHICPLEEVKKTKKPVLMEHIHYDKYGNARHIEVHGYPIFDNEGNVVQMSESAVDITERKRAEAELQMANKRMKSDLEAAAKIQKSLLPKEYLEISGVSFACAFKPCDELGGDILNVFQLDEKHVGLYVLDVSGHGVPAALLSAMLSRVLSPLPGQSYLLKQRIGGSLEYRLVPPAEVAEQMNWQFPMNLETQQYFTLLYGILNLETHEFRYVSAGHLGPIYLSRDSEPAILEESGLPIGLVKEVNYEECSVSMKPGDRLYLYSDGITEATNSNNEQFGKRRLISVLDQSRETLLKDSISSLLRSVEEWCGDVRLEDDVSVLAVEIAEKATSHIS